MGYSRSAWGTSVPDEAMSHFTNARAATTRRHTLGCFGFSQLPDIAHGRCTTGPHDSHRSVGRCPTSPTHLPSGA